MLYQYQTPCIDRYFAKDCRQLRKGWAPKEEAYIKKVMVNNFDPDHTVHLVRSTKPGHHRQLIWLFKSTDIVQAYCDCAAGTQMAPLTIQCTLTPRVSSSMLANC
ncbi:hypothetical protein HPB47_013959 [Ixodes persulcatus]|uniref:Uncharacterized protein n=1 Tax=Ixodes persulcatus TaxID=34615 RepID=A0AC60QX59_IXOPE|nr:hypothetical protein HPB47_013959 [Ixodes persulcatus]